MADLTGKTSIGFIAKPHGIKGELRFVPNSANPEDHSLTKKIFLLVSGELKEFEIQALNFEVSRKSYIMKLIGVEDRNSSETMSGLSVYVSDEDLAELKDNEFYIHELMNSEVLDSDGVKLGKVTNVLENSEHGILAIQDGEASSEILFPLTEESIIEFDPINKRLIVKMIPGLLELYGR